jgi:hypothetical protein
MELIPELEIGWLNGWILPAFERLIQGFLISLLLIRCVSVSGLELAHAQT